MEKKKETHHIQISPELLFGSKNKYKVFYVPWIYVYLKLEKCIIFDNKIHLSSHQLKKHYKVDRKTIYNFYGFDKTTLSRALHWLNVMGLIEINGKEHKLINDNTLFHYEKNDPEKDINKTDDGEGFFPSFVQIYYNFYIDFVELLKEKFKLSKSPGLLMRTVETFYYLITRNRHILLDIETCESEETASTISKYLHHDKEDIKKCLWCLNEIGYITTDIDGKIYTHYKYGKSKINKRKATALRRKEYNVDQQLQQTDHLSPQWNTDLIYNEAENFKVTDSSHDLSTEVTTVKVNEEQTHINKDQVNTKQENKYYPVTNKELIGHYEIMSNGDNEKFERLIKEHNISDISVEEWKLEKLKKNECSSDINKLEKLKDKNRTEMDYETAKQHLDYLFAIYKDDSKMFGKEIERRKIPDEMLNIWLEEMAEEFAFESEEL
ncbi:MAG: hypothetical protein PHN88_04695 [Ignavibacteria bacterium]|nr:hypothetical protein [Ignavibacteria bacterium]